MENNVLPYREERGLSTDELARAAGISVSCLSAIESGRRTARVDHALALAKALGATVEALFAAPSETFDATVESLDSTRASGEFEDLSFANVGANEPLFGVAAVANGRAPLDSLRKVYAPGAAQKISSYFSRTATEEGLARSPATLRDPTRSRSVRYFDLFCGIGGFRIAAERALRAMNRVGECALSCDVDRFVQQSYAANFGDAPVGDVAALPSEDIPDFDLLFAGFPCQSFSIIGLRKGFEDETKGSLFFQIARILRDKRPRAFVLENVRQLTTHDGGRTFDVILRALQDELGYYVDWRVMNALDCGLPQKRERVVIVGAVEPFDLEWPRKKTDCKTLEDVLLPDRDVPKRYLAKPKILARRLKMHKSRYSPSIWHENKSGRISSYPYSCALRAGASYNYLLVNGARRLTPLEMLRLQGFPDDFKIVVSESQLRKQVGNAVPVDMIERVLERFLPLVFEYGSDGEE